MLGLVEQGETCCPNRVARLARLAGIRAHNLEHSMSRRGNCHDNAVAESFFNLHRRKRIRRKTYKTRAAARQDIFDYIEMFYNPKPKHARNGMLPPVEF